MCSVVRVGKVHSKTCTFVLLIFGFFKAFNVIDPRLEGPLWTLHAFPLFLKMNSNKF